MFGRKMLAQYAVIPKTVALRSSKMTGRRRSGFTRSLEGDSRRHSLLP